MNGLEIHIVFLDQVSLQLNGTTSGSLGGLGSATDGVNSYTAITASQLETGDAYSFSVSYTAGDSIESSLTTGEVSPFGSITSTSGGVAGDLAGTIDTKGAMDLTAGGAGTSVTGQFVVGLTHRLMKRLLLLLIFLPVPLKSLTHFGFLHYRDYEFYYYDKTNYS